MFRRTGFTALYLDIEHQPNVADPVGVQSMARPSRLGWVVANLGTCLVTIQQFDAGVGIEYLGCA